MATHQQELQLNYNGTALDLRDVKLGDGSLLRPVAPPATSEAAAPSNRPAVRFRIAHLTGTTAFKLSPAQRKELSDFTERGGTLIVDAAGGSDAFADAAERESALVFGGTAKEVVPSCR